MTTESSIRLAPDYFRAIRFGANWTMITSPYLILSVIAIFAIGGTPIVFGEIGPALEIAGKAPIVFGATVMLDAIFHAVFALTAVTLFAVLRERWPVRASLVLASGTWQMVVGLTKGLSSLLMFVPLGSAYIAGDSALRAVLLPVASSEFGLRLALQTMDGFGVMAIWLIVCLLPSDSAIPRGVRWLGWIMTLALLAATPSGPTFLLVAALFPVWLFLMGRWLTRLMKGK